MDEKEGNSELGALCREQNMAKWIARVDLDFEPLMDWIHADRER